MTVADTDKRQLGRQQLTWSGAWLVLKILVMLKFSISKWLVPAVNRCYTRREPHVGTANINFLADPTNPMSSQERCEMLNVTDIILLTNRADIALKRSRVHLICIALISVYLSVSVIAARALLPELVFFSFVFSSFGSPGKR